MADRILVDTIILVYAYDRSEPEKQDKAATILNQFIKVGCPHTHVLLTILGGIKSVV